jgi:hypothetical protein
MCVYGVGGVWYVCVGGCGGVCVVGEAAGRGPFCNFLIYAYK